MRYTRFFISNQIAKGLKVKQLANLPPTLKTSTEKFLHNCFWPNLIVYMHGI